MICGPRRGEEGPCTRSHKAKPTRAKALPAAQGPGRGTEWGKCARLREGGGKVWGPGRWKRGWKDPLGVRGRNREQAKERKGHRHRGLRLGDEAL